MDIDKDSEGEEEPYPNIYVEYKVTAQNFETERAVVVKKVYE